MSGTTTAIIGFAVLLLLIAIRMPIGLAMLLTGSVGYISFIGLAPFLSYMKSTPYHLFANYTLSIIPLFILMGAFAERSGLSADLFRAAAGFFGRRKGGLGMAVIGASTLLGQSADRPSRPQPHSRGPRCPSCGATAMTPPLQAQLLRSEARSGS